MKQNLGRVTRAVLFSVTGFLICVAFQNCSGYAADNNPLYDNASINTCVGLACEEDDTLLRISINNDSPVVVKNATMGSACGADDSTCVDLGGMCDDGGFENHMITYTISGGTVGAGETQLPARCVDGRYSAQIKLPAGFDFANIHVLRLTIYGLQNGERINNSSNGNFREINIASYL